VTPRTPSPYPRQFVYILCQVKRPIFDLLPYQRSRLYKGWRKYVRGRHARDGD
jgi:hypothetical protein